jgi:S1-C subfamily serine protease
LVLGTCGTAAQPPVPDLTQGGKKDDLHDWTLGPTGARGWVWGWQCQTTLSRQILITDVAAGSPADGVLQKGDVLLGVNGKPFDDDARILYARAITAAEKEGGILRLVRWREGRTEHVEVKLAVMGA